jgi:hypothetical protein
MQKGVVKQHSQTAQDLLDRGLQANNRVLAVSNLLMSGRDTDSPEPDDLRVIAHLIHSETEKMRDCLQHFRQALKESLPPET